MKRFLDWLDQRTGCKKICRETLFENVPGGARWRYVWGSTLTFGLVVQFITGIFLWMAYSPSSHTAWESVYYIQDDMTGGWLLRGLHHYTAHAMTILLVLHLMQVVIDGAYKAPREVNFWFGLALLLLVLGLSLTGYLLPWDQKGYWATKVATNLAGIMPIVGPDMQKTDHRRHGVRPPHADAILRAACGSSAGDGHRTRDRTHLSVPSPRHHSERTETQARCCVLAGSNAERCRRVSGGTRDGAVLHRAA